MRNKSIFAAVAVAMSLMVGSAEAGTSSSISVGQDSQLNVLVVDQNADMNNVDVFQAGQRNISLLRQSGQTNSVGATQVGGANALFVTQTGKHNLVDSYQVGVKNTANITQTVGNPAVITPVSGGYFTLYQTEHVDLRMYTVNEPAMSFFARRH